MVSAAGAVGWPLRSVPFGELVIALLGGMWIGSAYVTSSCDNSFGSTVSLLKSKAVPGANVRIGFHDFISKL